MTLYQEAGIFVLSDTQKNIVENAVWFVSTITKYTLKTASFTISTTASALQYVEDSLSISPEESLFIEYNDVECAFDFVASIVIGSSMIASNALMLINENKFVSQSNVVNATGNLTAFAVGAACLGYNLTSFICAGSINATYSLLKSFGSEAADDNANRVFEEGIRAFNHSANFNDDVAKVEAVGENVTEVEL